MIKCPNKNLPEWKELERLCPNTCYIVWDAFPYGIDKAPNGADSRLFRDLLEHYKGDRDSAIKAKSKTVTDAFKTWFGDWSNNPNQSNKIVDENGEPTIKDGMFTNGKGEHLNLDDTEIDSIYRKINNEVQQAKKDLFTDNEVYNRVFYYQMREKHDTASALKFMLNTGYVLPQFRGLAEMLTKHSTKLVMLDVYSDDNTMAYYDQENQTIYLYKNSFKQRPEITAADLMHEILHYYLGNKYDMDAKYRNNVNRIQAKYRRLANKDEMANIYALYADGDEFVNEALSNPYFVQWLRKKDEGLWQKLLRVIAKALSTIGIKTGYEYNTNDILNELTNLVEVIANRDTPYSKDIYSWDAVRSMYPSAAAKRKADSEFIKNMETNVRNVSAGILGGIQSRIKALQQYGKATTDRVMKLEQELVKLQELFEKNEDKQAMLEFIKHTSREADRPLRVINKAFDEYKSTGKFSLRNDQMVQLQRDFIGFYEPIIEDINNKLYILGYFDDMTPAEKAFINEQMSLITKSFTEIKGKYDSLLAKRFGEILIQWGEASGSPTIKAYVDDYTNTTNTDLSFYSTFIGGMRFVKDEALRLIAKRVTDTQNNIERVTLKKATELYKTVGKVKDWQIFYEKDSKGKKTGYLVRDRRYGEFYRNYEQFMSSIGESPIGDDTALAEWNKLRNEWLSKNAERRYKPEYYDLFNNLGFAAKEARDGIQTEISLLLSSYIDDKGEVHLENIPDTEYERLQNLYKQKKMLAIHFYSDGTAKTGIDLEIADQLSDLNEELNKNLSYKVNKERFEKIRAEKERTLTPEQYKKWYDRSTRVGYSEEFTEWLNKHERKYYNDEYEILSKERRELNSMYRNYNNLSVNTIEMPDSVKERIREIDVRLMQIASTYPSEKTDFFDFATIKTSAYYKHEKEKAIERDKIEPGYYEKWRNKNHYIDSYGRLVPYSYYNIIVPVKKSHLEILPSKEFSEIDPSSPFYNENFDPSIPDHIQPKKELYDNTDAYNKIMNNDANKNAYDAILATMTESNDKLSFMKRKNNYKLPQISGTMWAYMKANDSLVKGFTSFVKDKVSVRQDDVDYNDDYSTSPDGRRLSTLPVHYVKMLDDPSTITNDLMGAVIKYFMMAENYKQKQAMLPELELLQRQIENRRLVREAKTETSGIMSKADELISEAGRRLSSKSGATNTITRLNQYYGVNVFGRSYNPIKIGKFNIVKILVGFKNYATVVNLGLSPYVASANIMGALHQHIMESIAGVYYTPKTAAVAFKECVWHYGKVLFNIGNYKHSNKMLSLMNYNQVARDSQTIYDKLNYLRPLRAISNHIWYGMMSVGDFAIKSQMMTSVYLNTKYVPGEGFLTREDYINKFKNEPGFKKSDFDKLTTPTLWDMYEADGVNVKIKDKYKSFSSYITPEFENKITNIVKYLTQRADGMVDPSEKNLAQANAITGFAFMHKNFILSALEDRVLKPTAYNYMTERMDEAQYKSAWTAIKNNLRYARDMVKYLNTDAASRGEKPKRQRLEDFQKYNVKRVIAELSSFIVYQLISMLLTRWDDEEDTFTSNAILYMHSRAFYEATNLYNVWDIVNSFKTLTPAMSTLENLRMAMNIANVFSWEENFDKSIKYGPYKGMTKWERAVWKASPLKNLIEATDPKQKLKYLKGQLQ